MEDTTPLIWAVRAKQPEIVSLLIGKGADFDQKNNKGKTALDFAIEGDCIETVRILQGLIDEKQARLCHIETTGKQQRLNETARKMKKRNMLP